MRSPRPKREAPSRVEWDAQRTDKFAMQSWWMLLAGFLFACMGVCVKLVAATHSAVEIVFYRSFLALPLLYALLRVRHVPLRTSHWRWQVGRAVCGFVAVTTYFMAITLLPLATAVTLNYTSAIFLAIFLALAGSRPPIGLVGSVLAGLGGVGLLLQPTLHGEQWPAALIGLSSGVMAALAYFSVRELGSRGEPETRTVFYFSLLSSVGAGAWLVHSEGQPVDLASGALLVGVAVFATSAQLAMTRAYGSPQTLFSAALAYSTVVFASLFSAVLWDEMLDGRSWLAIGLIIAAGLAASHYSRDRCG